MRSGGRAAGSLRSNWRQQQATKAACEAALQQPTLAARAPLLQARLAPLFASHGATLASEAVIWGGYPDNTQCADGSGGGGGSVGAVGGDAASQAGGAQSGKVSGSTRCAILRHVRGLQGVDGWRGLNRAVVHALLFAAWGRARAAGALSAPSDHFAPDAEWRLSTGAPPLLCGRPILRGSGM